MKKSYYKRRLNSEIFEEKILGFGLIRFLYSSVISYPLLKIIAGNMFISKFYGKLMNTELSKILISKFIKKYNINISECKKKEHEFLHFNDFFYRDLKPLARKIDFSHDVVVSPADGKILVYNSDNEHCFPIKGFVYDIKKLLQNKMLSEKYEKYSIAIIRLAPTDYHRFHFPIDGYISQTTLINGFYHSVSPIALFYNPKIFFENKRTVCEIMHSKIGTVLFIEIGASLVGSIKQTYTPNSYVKKGDEKGYFEFGGSTVILLFQFNKIKFDNDLMLNTKNNYETQISMGERIGVMLH